MKKRILAIAATPYFADRGGHIRVYNVLKYVEKSGYEVRLATYGLGYDPTGVNFPVIRSANLPWYKKLTPGASIWKPLLDIPLLFTAIVQRFKFRPKIIQPFQYEALAIAVMVKYLTFSRAKIVFDCQGSVSQEIQQYNFKKPSLVKKMLIPVITLFEKLLLWFPSTVLCSSVNSYNFLHTAFNIPEAKLLLLQDGIDMDLFNGVTQAQADDKRSELGIPLANHVIIYTGSLNRAKGVDKLLEDLSVLLPQMPQTTFVFLGYGDLQAEYEKVLSQYIAAKQVVFLGKTHYFDLPLYLKMSNFGIDPKQDSSESSGKLYNYVAAGLPVICFRSELNSAVLGNGGVYIDEISQLSSLDLRNPPSTSPVLDALDWNNIVGKYNE